MKTFLLKAVAALLCFVVGYLALDRQEKSQAAHHAREFKAKYGK